MISIIPDPVQGFFNKGLRMMMASDRVAASSGDTTLIYNPAIVGAITQAQGSAKTDWPDIRRPFTAKSFCSGLTLLLLVCYYPAQALTVKSSPIIAQNPNPRAPLAAVLRFSTDTPVTTQVEVSDGERSWTVVFDPSEKPEGGLPLIGMRAGRQHTFKISLTGPGGNKVELPEILNYTTPPLPPAGKEFPTIDVKLAKTELMEPGVTLLSVRRRYLGRAIWATPKQVAFTKDWGLLLALDEQGEVVWYYIAEARIAGVDRLNNGHIYFQLMDSRTVEIDMLGNIINQWYATDRPEGPLPGGTAVQTQTLHHQPVELPNGHFLSFSAIARKIDNYYTSEWDPNAPRKTQWVMGDSVLEFNRAGEILWKWDSFDHLDVNRIGYNLNEPYWHTRGFPHHLDWTHGNGVSYNAQDDSVMLSFRNQDAIIKLDKSSGEVKWILGPHDGWTGELASKLLTPVGEGFRWPYHGHNPRITHAGTVAVLDNAPFQSMPFNPKPWVGKVFSRGVEYDVDEQAMTVRQVWQSDKELDDDSCFSFPMGEVHRLQETDNMLTIFALCAPIDENIGFDEWDSPRHYMEYPHGGRVREYLRDDNATLIYDVRIEDEDQVMQWEVYGGLRIPNLYPSDDEKAYRALHP